MLNPRTTRSTPALIPPSGDTKRILQKQEFFCITYQCKDPKKFDEAERELNHTLNQAFESLERKHPPQSPAPLPQSATVPPDMAERSDLHLSKQLRHTIAQVV